MSEEDQMKQHLAWIRAYGRTIGLHNWRDIRLQMNRQFDELEALLTMQKLKEPLHSPAAASGAPEKSADV